MNIYILAFLLLFTISSSSLLKDRHSDLNTVKAGTAKIVFKSTDGGQTWQDISNGLPKNLQQDGRNNFFANDKGLFIKVGNGLYHNTPDDNAPIWTKEEFPDQYRSMEPDRPGIPTSNFWGMNLKNSNGTTIWSPIFSVGSPIYENFQGAGIRTGFETAGGAFFIGTDRGFFKSADRGKSWRFVHAGSLAGHLAELDGILLAISNRRIIRSTDNGENWSLVTSDSSVAFDVKQIKGGFAAMTSTSESNPRGLRTSYDGGKTWQPNNEGNKVLIDSIWRTWNDRPSVKAIMTPITRVGENFICTLPYGLFKSSDKGKKWKLLLPPIKNKVFNLLVSGNVIYAIPIKGGC